MTQIDEPVPDQPQSPEPSPESQHPNDPRLHAPVLIGLTVVNEDILEVAYFTRFQLDYAGTQDPNKQIPSCFAWIYKPLSSFMATPMEHIALPGREVPMYVRFALAGGEVLSFLIMSKVDDAVKGISHWLTLGIKPRYALDPKGGSTSAEVKPS